MQINLARDRNNGQTTLGGLFIDWTEWGCATLEDGPDSGRIPAGTYQIKFREVKSPLQETYKNRFPNWFTWHLELQDVPGRKYIYIHLGNSHKDTLGCILVGQPAQDGEWMVWNSATTYKAIYIKVSEAINRGEDVFITIIDEDETDI